MASIMGSVPLPHYDMYTEDEVADARLDLIGKVCEYLNRRLALYQNNIKTLRQEDKDEAQPCQYVTSEGWAALFHAEPLAHGRRVCSYLYAVVIYTNDFWQGCSYDEFLALHSLSHPVRGQPQNLSRKHFLFFKYLFDYLDYIEDEVQQAPFSLFDEGQELKHFLSMLVSTQFLLSDLLDMTVTPTGRQRTKLRDHADTLYESVHACTLLERSWRITWLNTRGDVTTDVWQPTEACEKGHFDVLGTRRLPGTLGQVRSHGNS